MRRLLLSLLAFFACDGADPLQLIGGAVEPDGFPRPPAQVRAFATGGDRVGAMPLEPDGSFVVAVPPGPGLRLDLADAAGERVAWLGDDGAPLVLAICAPGDPLDLGTVAFDRSACSATPACVGGHDRLLRCLEAQAPGACHRCPGEACSRERAEWERCTHAGAADCEPALRRLRACHQREGCVPDPATCDGLCPAERARMREACAVCAPDSPSAAVERVPPPVGCGAP